MKIENCFYSVELDEQLRFTLSDKRFGGVWNSDAPFQLRYGHCWDFPLREHAEHSVECENGIMRMSAMRGAMKREVPLSYALVIVRGVRAAQRKPATQRAR